NKPDGRSEKFGSSAGPASTTSTRIKMACILITGGAGYVGSHCAKALAAEGHDGIVFDNLTFGHREFIRWGRLIDRAEIGPAAVLQRCWRRAGGRDWCCRRSRLYSPQKTTIRLHVLRACRRY